jgi:hypothetical protein
VAVQYEHRAAPPELKRAEVIDAVIEPVPRPPHTVKLKGASRTLCTQVCSVRCSRTLACVRPVPVDGALERGGAGRRRWQHCLPLRSLLGPARLSPAQHTLYCRCALRDRAHTPSVLALASAEHPAFSGAHIDRSGGAHFVAPLALRLCNALPCDTTYSVTPSGQ